jgi:hypothetical protein
MFKRFLTTILVAFFEMSMFVAISVAGTLVDESLTCEQINRTCYCEQNAKETYDSSDEENKKILSAKSSLTRNKGSENLCLPTPFWCLSEPLRSLSDDYGYFDEMRTPVAPTARERSVCDRIVTIEDSSIYVWKLLSTPTSSRKRASSAPSYISGGGEFKVDLEACDWVLQADIIELVSFPKNENK